MKSVYVQTFVRASDFHAFTRPFVLSYPEIPAFTRLLCLHILLCGYVQTFVFHQTICAFTSKFSCVFFRGFRLCKVERTTTLPCVYLDLDISTFHFRPQPGYSRPLIFGVGRFRLISWEMSGPTLTGPHPQPHPSYTQPYEKTMLNLNGAKRGLMFSNVNRVWNSQYIFSPPPPILDLLKNHHKVQAHPAPCLTNYESSNMLEWGSVRQE